MSLKKKVRIGGTVDRTLGFTTPSVADQQCPYFSERFIRFGLPNTPGENRAICEKRDSAHCDYRYDHHGAPICMRYWYGPHFELKDLIKAPLVQKRNEAGQPIFYEEDGVTETIMRTSSPVMLQLHEQYPVEDTVTPKIQLTDDDDNLLYWDYTTDLEPKLTVDVTNFPAYEHRHMQFYSKQYIDTHNRKLGVSGNELDWKNTNTGGLL